MYKTLKNLGFYSTLAAGFIVAPLDTPVHRFLNPYKIKIYEASRRRILNILGTEKTYLFEHFLLSADLMPSVQLESNPLLTVTLPDGRKVENPIVLGAGYDKDAKIVESLFGLGFGGVEVGSITPQEERPTLRLKCDPEAQIVKSETYGESWGVMMAKSNLHAYYRRLKEKREDAKDEKLGEKRLVGINYIPNLETQENAPYLALSEFQQCSREFVEYGDYMVLNISNGAHEAIKQYRSEKKLRELIRNVKRIRTLESGYQAAFDYEVNYRLKNKVVEQAEMEDNLFHSVYNHYERNRPDTQKKTPLVFIKIDANLPKEELQNLAKVALEEELDGIVVGSASGKTSYSLGQDAESGSELIGGKPNREFALNALQTIYQQTRGKIALISSGGVLDAQDVMERIKNGANLVQIFSSFILEGPYMVPHLVEDLSKQVEQELRLNNVKNLDGLVGIQVKPEPQQPTQPQQQKKGKK